MKKRKTEFNKTRIQMDMRASKVKMVALALKGTRIGIGKLLGQHYVVKGLNECPTVVVNRRILYRLMRRPAHLRLPACTRQANMSAAPQIAAEFLAIHQVSLPYRTMDSAMVQMPLMTENFFFIIRKQIVDGKAICDSGHLTVFRMYAAVTGS